MKEIFLVGLGGFIGTVLRYGISSSKLSENTVFPYKTFFINILGSFLIGLIFFLAGKYKLDKNMVNFIKIGVCGGFTTFSSFSLESFNLLKAGHIFLFLTYVILSVVLGILAIYLAEIILK